MTELLDANILLYAVDEDSPHFQSASEWLIGRLDRPERLALPWQTIGAFLRISTHPRIYDRPLDSRTAWMLVEQWIGLPAVWIPNVSESTARLLGEMIVRDGITANLVPDALLAAIAVQNGLTVISADSDFARFTDVRWENPLTP